ncbi:hypothetical protein Golob_016226, partial [Gossypium lobatum]|nr:hypothetical protein [Gossypium lobatum]
MLKLEEQQSLGEASCALSEIVTKPNRSLTLDLVRRVESVSSTHSQHHGKLTVHAEECFSSRTTAEMMLSCLDLESKDLFSKCDPFLVVSKLVESGISIPVCKTEVLKNDHNPTWKPVFLNIQQVGSKLPFLGLIRKVQKSLADLEKIHSGREGENLFLPTLVGHDCENKILKSKLFVENFSETVQHTFLDYLAGGVELNFMVAIDF